MDDQLLFQMYLDEIKEVKECDAEENQLLTAQVLSGSQEAKSRLIEGNLMKALGMIRSYLNQGVQTGDLVQEANMALVMAVEELTAQEEAVQFDEYIKEKVDAALRAIIEEQNVEQKIEEKILSRINSLDEVSREMAKQLGREATAEELAERMQMSVDEVKEIMKQTLDAMSVTGEYEQSLEELAEEQEELSEEEQLAEKLLRQEKEQPKIRRTGR